MKDNTFTTRKIIKKDFLLVPLYYIFYILIPLLMGHTLIKILSFVGINLTKKETDILFLDITSLTTLVGEIIILLSFYLMHRKSIIPIAIARIKELKKHVALIVICLSFIFLMSDIYDNVIYSLPEKFQYDETVNQMEINKMFTHKWMLPFLFLDITILTPFIEELLMRHLLIHELGKKLTYGLMNIVSVIIFAYLHCTQAKSPFEIGPYLIIAIGLVSAYHFSGRNLAVAILMHMILSVVAFISVYTSII